MSQAKISLLSHASVLIEVDGKKIVTDPWYFGTAFNDGWELNPKPDLEQIKGQIQDVDIIWISHEHPDHLHFPTLKWLAEFVRKDVTVFFQATNSEKVFSALKRLGYQSFIQMPHMKKIAISPNVQLACYAHRHLDSSLAVFVDNHFWLLNVNDTELSTGDCSLISKQFGNPTVVYNQFSIAGSDGVESSLKNYAAKVMSEMVRQHKELKARLTVPFASFVRFARTDNAYINAYANDVFEVNRQFADAAQTLCVQAYGSGALVWEDPTQLPVNMNAVHSESLHLWEKTENPGPDLHEYSVISAAEVQTTIESRIKAWRDATNPILWRFLKLEKITVLVRDWGDQVWEIDFNNATFSQVNAESAADIQIASQPLHQAFKMPFGIQTLGVSGRYQFGAKYQTVPASWKKIRILSSLFNAEIYLSLSSIFSSSTARWIWQRRLGLSSQIVQQVKRFKGS